jgi:hypothetical protein
MKAEIHCAPASMDRKVEFRNTVAKIKFSGRDSRHFPVNNNDLQGFRFRRYWTLLEEETRFV